MRRKIDFDKMGSYIVEGNLSYLRKPLKSYKYLYRVIQRKSLRSFIFNIYYFLGNHNATIVNYQCCYFLGTKTLKLIRGKKEKSELSNNTTNRYFHYLCAVGIINKLFQNNSMMLDINKKFLKENPTKNCINAIYLLNWKDENDEYIHNRLKRMDDRAKILEEYNITPTNICYEKLFVNGLVDIADKTYYIRDKKKLLSKIEKDLSDFLLIKEFIENHCALNGYTTKNEIYENINFKQNKIDFLFDMFKDSYLKDYQYIYPSYLIKQKLCLNDKMKIIIKKTEEA